MWFFMFIFFGRIVWLFVPFYILRIIQFKCRLSSTTATVKCVSVCFVGISDRCQLCDNVQKSSDHIRIIFFFFKKQNRNQCLDKKEQRRRNKNLILSPLFVHLVSIIIIIRNEMVCWFNVLYLTHVVASEYTWNFARKKTHEKITNI